MTSWQLGSGWLAQKIQRLLKAKQWHWLILLIWMVSLLLSGFFDLDHQSLMAHDEGLYARRARVIVDSGDWVHPWATPHHKTPGPYWVVALFIQILGRHEVAVRLPSVLASLGCLWLTYRIGRRLLSPTAAFLGSLSLGLAPLWLQYSRLATPDVLFTGLILLAIWLLLEADARPDWSHRNWLYVGAGSALGLTVLMRSALAMVPMACLLPYLLLSGRHHLRRWSFYLGGLVGLIPTALWLWFCWRRYDMAVINALVNFPVSQGLTTDRAKSPLFYLFNLLVNDFLWIFFTLGAVVLLVGGLTRSNTKFKHLCQPQISLLLLYPLAYLGSLSFASTKLPHYAIPTYPFLALLAGYAMERLIERGAPKGIVRRLLASINGLFVLLGGLLAVAACLALTTQFLPDEIRPYAPIALALGGAWLGASLLWFRGQLQYRALSWLAVLLLGQWLSLVLAWGTADLGNINPDMKALLIRDDIRPILQTESVSFAPGLNSKRSTLLRFYTPNLGDKLQTLEQVSPGDYLWIEDTELSSLPQAYDVLGQIKQTYLVRIRSQ